MCGISDQSPQPAYIRILYALRLHTGHGRTALGLRSTILISSSYRGTTFLIPQRQKDRNSPHRRPAAGRPTSHMSTNQHM